VRTQKKVSNFALSKRKSKDYLG